MYDASTLAADGALLAGACKAPSPNLARQARKWLVMSLPASCQFNLERFMKHFELLHAAQWPAEVPKPTVYYALVTMYSTACEVVASDIWVGKTTR